MAILDSVRKLAEKVGADTNGRDIADQINIINKHLDNTQPGSRDIAEAVSKFADKEDGTAILTTKTITENKTYKASDDGASGYSSVTVNVATPTPETFEVEIETLFPGNGEITTVNKTYQQIKSEIDLGKKLTGISTAIINTPETEGQSIEMWSANLETVYISDFYGNSGTKEATDAIIILTKPFLFCVNPITAPQSCATAIAAFAITPDDKVWCNIGFSWMDNVAENSGH